MKIFQTNAMQKDSVVTEENYYLSLNAVPPRIMTTNAFLVGEAWDHNGEDGYARYQLYFTENGKYYYGGLATVKEFNLFLIEDKPEEGKIYSLTGGSDTPSISNGNTWAESEVKSN